MIDNISTALKFAKALFEQEDALDLASNADTDAGDLAAAELPLFQEYVLNPAMIRIARLMITHALLREDRHGVDAVIENWLSDEAYRFSSTYPDDREREFSMLLGSRCKELVAGALSASKTMTAEDAAMFVIDEGTGPYGVRALSASLSAAPKIAPVQACPPPLA